MVDLNLVNYIRQLLQYGYDINAVRSRLLTSGYDPGLVDEAVNYLYQGREEQAPKPSFLDHFKTKKFIIALSGIIGLIIVAFLVLTFAGGAPEPIGLYISPVSSQVTQGESISFTKSMVNVEGQGMVSFSYEIIDVVGDTAATGQESASAQSIPLSFQIAIPESTPPGSYTLKAVARFGDQKAESRFTFTVLGKAEEAVEEGAFEPAMPGVEEGPEAPGAEEAPPEEPDNDNDGVPDSADTDDDNDGIIDSEDSKPLDHDNDGIPDATDTDADNDGILDKFDLYPFDMDNDGIGDIDDTDNDNDGILDLDDTYPFDYDNDGVLDKDDDDTGRAFTFPAEQEAAELSFKCATDIECNDFDACSIDKCVGGACENTPQSPCCGNFVCETGETTESCSQDCWGATPSGQDRIAEILATAAANPEVAAAECGKIERVKDADRCYFELAKETKINGFCKNIYTEKTWDSCHMYFVINLDEFEHCEEIHNRYLQNSCYSIEGMKEMESQI